ncbi:inositol monophosphatase family protein [Bacillus massiliigorillae]|uniref:inositol monophosphatase family protein n=1 Tax=Bacillus massiliigorillae TaxID=1243664 RepID=UPI0003A870B1|nr:inositol monophosphatase family protein [Bacillus massiliigorillae]
MNSIWTEIEANAKQWMKEAGEKIMTSFQSKLHIQVKSDRTDLVTNIDKEVEAFFLQKIKEEYPSHQILGEEGAGHHITDRQGIVWIIDPIDGTLNFIHQKRNFAISIGIFEDGIGKLGMIYDVVQDELYHAIKGQGAFLNEQRINPLQHVNLQESMISINASWLVPNSLVQTENAIQLVETVRGTRSIGSAALGIVSVVTGRMDAYLSMRLAPWDIAGGLILIEEVGAQACDLEGRPITFPKSTSFIVARPGLSEEILGILKKNRNS